MDGAEFIAPVGMVALLDAVGVGLVKGGRGAPANEAVPLLLR